MDNTLIRNRRQSLKARCQAAGRLLLLSAALLASGRQVLAQSVIFNQQVYHTGETVKATLLSKAGLDNDLRARSEQLNAGDQALGVPAKPGYYRLAFTFANGAKESYLILVFPPGEGSGSATGLLKKSVSITPAPFSTLCTSVSKATGAGSGISLTDVAKNAGAEFLRTHVLGTTLTVTFCLSSGVNPGFAYACSASLRANGLDFATIFLNELVKELYRKGKITEGEYTASIGVILTAKTLADVIEAQGKFAVLLAGTSNAVSLSGNENLCFGIEQQKGVYDNTKIMIEIGKRL